MHHYFEAITNTSGDSLVGYFARVIDPASLNTITLSADDNGTPIVTVSGIENMASTDAYGNLDFYVVPGTYHLDIYAPNATSFIMRIANVAMNSAKGDPGAKGDQGDVGVAANTFSTIASLKAAPVSQFISANLVGVAGTQAGSLFYETANAPYTVDNAVVFEASVSPSVGAWVRDTSYGVTPAMFGAKGNGTADDAAAFNAALAWRGNHGGGIVWVPSPASFYRVTDTITIPANVGLVGPVAVQFPFSNAAGVARIVADFPAASRFKWVIEALSYKTGTTKYAYNEIVVGNLPAVPAYNCGVRNLLITAINTIPYGGLRLHGAPGAFATGVGITNVGNGFLLNYSFDCELKVHSMGVYVGSAIWGEVNACSGSLYSAQGVESGSTYAKVIPTAYRLGFMSVFDGGLVAGRALATDTHTTRAFGLVAGSNEGSLSVNNNFDCVVERYSGGAFMINARGFNFPRFYLEGPNGTMDYGIVSANSKWDIGELHNYMIDSGAAPYGTLFDLGAGLRASVRPGGLSVAANFGTGPFSGDNSLLVVHDYGPDDFGPTPPRVAKVFHSDVPGAWKDLPTGVGWANNATYKPQYRINRDRLELRGFATGGVTGTNAVWTLPAGYRVSQLQNITGGFGALLAFDTDGSIKISSGTVLGLDGITLPLV